MVSIDVNCQVVKGEMVSLYVNCQVTKEAMVSIDKGNSFPGLTHMKQFPNLQVTTISSV